MSSDEVIWINFRNSTHRQSCCVCSQRMPRECIQVIFLRTTMHDTFLLYFVRLHFTRNILHARSSSSAWATTTSALSINLLLIFTRQFHFLCFCYTLRPHSMMRVFFNLQQFIARSGNVDGVVWLNKIVSCFILHLRVSLYQHVFHEHCHSKQSFIGSKQSAWILVDRYALMHKCIYSITRSSLVRLRSADFNSRSISPRSFWAWA